MENRKKETENGSGASKIPYGFIARVVLGIVGAAGVMGVGMAAPGAFQRVKLMRGYNRLAIRRYESPSYIRKTLKNLERRGVVRIFTRAGETKVYLTEKGQQELLKYRRREKRLAGGRWDKKWRIVTFDITEKRRYARDRIRTDMKMFGFEKLQDSVWVYPYECEEVTTLLKTRYRVGNELIYIVASDIENDGWLRKKFKL